jgi:sorting nexin-29
MATTPRISSRIQFGQNTRIATWNIQKKLSSDTEKETLISDLDHYNVDICSLQETCMKKYCHERTPKGGLIIGIAPDETLPAHQRYGLGFYVSKQWVPHLWSTKSISNRISVITFQLSTESKRRSQLTILNVYAPTTIRTTTNPAETEAFYDQLHNTISTYESTSMVIITGDFNAKLGQRTHTEEKKIIGKYGKGIRNISGDILAHFLTEHSLYATNTTFMQKLSRRTTWTGTIKSKQIFNQIDYIIIQQSALLRRNIIKSSRSYEKLNFQSDHKLVITNLNLSLLYIQPTKQPTFTTPKYNVNLLSSDDRKRIEYRKEMENRLPPPETHIQGTPNQQIRRITKIIHDTATSIIPPEINQRNKRNRYSDKIITDLSNRKAKINRRIYHTKSISKSKALRKKRNNITNKIKQRICTINHQKIDTIAKELESNKGNRRCFMAARLLQHQQHQPFTLIDSNKTQLSSPESMLPKITKYYLNFYNQDGLNCPSPWIENPTPLDTPISATEIEEAIKRLNNNRAPGKDGLSTELFKNASYSLVHHLAHLFKSIFENHLPCNAICDGLLIALNKPKKSFTIDNTRPITLLNTVRKILSNIVLERIYPIIDKYVNINQSGFRRGRSTSDLVWSYKWLMAITTKYEQEFEIMGIDLSKAFDCINREMLLGELKTILPLSSYRIVRFLLSNTTLQAKLQNKLGKKFKTSIGTPQGDGLSPLLFIFYLEMALRYHQQQTNDLLGWNITTNYADDTDFLADNLIENSMQLVFLKDHLARFNLKLNQDKTDFTILSKSNYNNTKTKKLGSILSDKEDMKYRIILANIAFNKMYKIWINKKHIKLDTKMRLYNACIKPILLYNTSSYGLSILQLKPLMVTHRRHLKRLANIFYPQRIKNLNLYKLCKTQPIIADITKLRWSLFGHILRSNINTPANQFMIKYLDMQGKRPRGHPMNTIATTIQLDLRYIHKKMTNVQEYNQLRELAGSRKEWKKLSKKIMKARIAEYEAIEAPAQKRVRERLPSPVPLDITDAQGQKRKARLTLQVSGILKISQGQLHIISLP